MLGHHGVSMNKQVQQVQLLCIIHVLIILLPVGDVEVNPGPLYSNTNYLCSIQLSQLFYFFKLHFVLGNSVLNVHILFLNLLFIFFSLYFFLL